MIDFVVHRFTEASPSRSHIAEGNSNPKSSVLPQVGPAHWSSWSSRASIDALSLMGLYSCFSACLRRLRSDGSLPSAEETDVDDSSGLFFELRSLQIATNFFSELNKLGHGGFGPVYKVPSFLNPCEFNLDISSSLGKFAF